MLARVDLTQKSISQKIANYKAATKAQYDTRNKTQDISIPRGSKVYVRDFSPMTSSESTLSRAKYKGPFLVLSQTKYTTLLEDCATKRQIRTHKNHVVSPAHLRAPESDTPEQIGTEIPNAEESQQDILPQTGDDRPQPEPIQNNTYSGPMIRSKTAQIREQEPPQSTFYVSNDLFGQTKINMELGMNSIFDEVITQCNRIIVKNQIVPFYENYMTKLEELTTSMILKLDTVEDAQLRPHRKRLIQIVEALPRKIRSDWPPSHTP